MLVQRVVMAGSGVESWTVLGADDVPIEPVERYLAYLTGIEQSPNTVKAYAHDLKDYWVFLAHRDLDWREVRLEDVGEFVAWLRLPPAGRSGQATVLPAVEPQVGASTINRKLSAVGAFYQYQARNGVDVGELLATCSCPAAVAGGSRFCTTSARAGRRRGGRSRCETRQASAGAHHGRDADDPGWVRPAPGSFPFRLAS